MAVPSSNAMVMLQISDGPDKGKSFELKSGANIIGRAPDSQVCLTANEISRQHLRIDVADDISVEDMGSALGTSLNGRLLLGKDYLFDNDELRIGPYVLRVSLQRVESRSGIVIAVFCLVVAVLICGISVFYPRAKLVESGQQQVTAQTLAQRQNHWRNWETLVLPSRKDLTDERIPINADAAQEQYNFATRLYQDRLGDLSNSYQALLHYKRAAALLAYIQPVEKRPTVANRCLSRIQHLRKQIEAKCEDRVFTFQRSSSLKWWGECTRVLEELQRITPWRGCRYNIWSQEQMQILRRMKK